MMVAVGLLGEKGCGPGIGRQRTSLSLLFVPAEVVAVDLVHLLPDDTIVRPAILLA